ncbi:MAG: hypothetical protein ACR2IT_08080, partial [Pirellulales bacterium]
AVPPPMNSRETPVVPGMPVVSNAAGHGTGHSRGAGPADVAAEPGRFEELVRRSPPLTLSLSLHILVLLALAVWIVQPRREAKLVLDLSFAAPEVVEAVRPGVQVVPQPVKEPEPEDAKTTKPPEEKPKSSPPDGAELSEAPGATPAKTPAPSVATLLDGRKEGQRAACVQAFGGSDATEAAVARALAWLAKQQDKKDGLWSLRRPYVDGGSQENRLAATAMALLAFQGAGNTPGAGNYRTVVKRGWEALVKKQLADGRFEFTPPIPSHHALYSHAQATIALCELYGMTRGEAHARPAQLALDYAIAAQGSNGGWRYEPGHDGDMSVTGWYMMALKSGQMAGLEVPQTCFDRLESFLESVAVVDGKRYGYRVEAPGRQPAQVTDAISAEGLLCRQYLGWRPGDRRLSAGLERLLAAKLFNWENDKDVYAWYYITQVAHHSGGDPWRRWNERMAAVLPAAQVKNDPEKGSWDPALDKWGHIGGRLFTTCFCTFMLEAYYRHLPLYAEEAVPAAMTSR